MITSDDIKNLVPGDTIMRSPYLLRDVVTLDRWYDDQGHCRTTEGILETISNQRATVRIIVRSSLQFTGSQLKS